MEQVKMNFGRYEKKFLITLAQYAQIHPVIREHMKADRYGVYPVCSVYFDTDTYSMIRTSLEKPTYKEKFRLRSYGAPKEEDLIFAEIKKKYHHKISKRRVAFHSGSGRIVPTSRQADTVDDEAQILEEIRAFFRRYPLKPAAFIGYQREAYTGKGGTGPDAFSDRDLRVTFDRDLCWRTEQLDLKAGDFGAPLLPDGQIVMEIKTPWAAPLWLVRLLSENRIYSRSFSKYGVCYQEQILPRLAKKGAKKYA